MRTFWKNKNSGVVWLETGRKAKTARFEELVSLKSTNSSRTARVSALTLERLFEPVVEAEETVTLPKAEFRAIVAQMLSCNVFSMLPYSKGDRGLLRAERMLEKWAGFKHDSQYGSEERAEVMKAVEEFSWFLSDEEMKERFPND